MLHVEQTADHCIKCNVCNTVCPVSAVTDLFPGPKYEGPQAQRFRVGVDTGDSPDRSLDYCSACGLCTQACPEGVLIAEINQVARERLVSARGGLGLRDNLVSRPSLLGALARPVAPLANLAMASRPLRVAVEKTIGVHRGAAMPRFSGTSFRSWARRHRAPADATRTVAYFHGCAVEEFEPEVGAAVVRVLERNRVRVVFPRQGCCGLPLVSNGDFGAGRRYATRLVGRLRAAADDPGVIVANSTSCGMTLKAKYRELLGLDDDATRAVSQAVYDVCEYLLELDDEGALDRSFAPVEARAVYHPPCQLMAHGVGTPATDLLAMVPGLVVERSLAGCCGTAGTYGTKVEKYQIAMDVGRTLFDQVAETRPDFVVCDSETCRWHIAKATGLPVYHPVQVLDHAYSAS
ncbi:MAG TPA: anaerobic glycerol-3-phosphate dehydrogenase subunit C [Actinomycetes bacterium]|nr:anaerobic glycerol-3-phosphate dehydrogenase subunit C [Actinomycetes bacterium]